MTGQPSTRRRGHALESAIFTAVWAELAAQGYGGFTVAGVAARAGTSKPVLYRRWPNRAHLVFAALSREHQRIEQPDTGSLRGDLLALMSAVASASSVVPPEAVWGLLAESASDEVFAASVRAELVDQLPARTAAAVVARAEARGEVPVRKRPVRELAVPFDLMRNEFFARGRVDTEAIEAILDDVTLPLLRRA